MEITIRYKRLIVVAFAAVACTLLLSLITSLVQAVDINPPEPASRAARVSPDLPWMPEGLSPVEVEQGSEPPGHYEPNDAITQSKKIVVCTPQKHYFEEEYDEDWMKFWAWDGYEYTIETYSLTVRNNTELWLYDPEYELLDHDDDSGSEPDASKIARTINANGTYFIKARHPTYNGGDGFDYSIHVGEGSILPYGDSYEPDNTMNEAHSITPGGTNQDHNFQGPCGGDVDWISFFAEAGTMYTVQTSDLSTGNDTVLTLYDSGGITVTINDDSHSLLISPPASQIEWVPVVSGTYYVKMEPFNPCAGGSDLDYTVEVDEDPMGTPATDPVPDPASDAYEYDDRAGWATPIVVNGGSQEDHTFYPAEDEDWVKFWALAGNEYTIQTLDLSGYNDTELYLYNKDMQQLGYSDDIDPPIPPPVDRASRIVWTAPANGTYFVKAKHQYDEGDTDFSYSLEITGTATCQDAYEADDTPSQTRPPITLNGAPQHHNFHNPCATDCGVTGYSVDVEDWAWFQAAAGTEYTIRTFDLRGDNDTVLGLYNTSEVELASNDDSDQDNLLASEIVWTAPASGPYYVKVSPFDRRIGGCDVVYSMTVTTEEYTLDTNTVGDGSIARSLFPPYYYYDNVVLTATAEPGWTFYEWSGALSGSANPDTISMYGGDKVVTATFTQNEYTLDVNIVGDGEVDVTPLKSFYYYGDEVTLDADANPGWSFGGWSGDLSGSDDPKTITITSDVVVTATFDEGAYILTVNTSGNGSVDKYPDQPTYGYGAVVTLTATADPGWSFDGWSGDLSGSDSPKPITIDGDKNVTATFTKDEYTLTVNVDPVGKGLVTKNPDQATYQYGVVVTLTATTTELGWEFAGWSGVLTSTNATEAITMDGNKVVTATFSPPAYIYLPLILEDWPPNTKPYTPSNLSPSDGATDRPINVELSWSGGDPDGDTVTYDIYLGDTSPPPPAKSNHTTTSYNPGALEYETEYHWYIVARDSRGAESDPGPEWSFTTVGCDCADTHEPDNNYAEGANFPTLVSGQSFESYICKEHVGGDPERDYYWFNFTSLSQITVDLAVPDTVNYDLFLWCTDLSNWLSSEKTGQGADEKITLNPPSTGGCWVIVKSLGDYDNCNPYGLKATFQ